MTSKRCVFLLNFSFDDFTGEAYAFSIDGKSARELGVPGMLATSAAEDGYASWMNQVREQMEEQYQSVHDISGTEDVGATVEGFMLYETPQEEAKALALSWHHAFVSRAGPEAVFPLVSLTYSIDDVGMNTGSEPALYTSATATEVADAVDRLVIVQRRRPRP